MSPNQTHRGTAIRQRICFFGLFVCITVFCTVLFADWLNRTGYTPAKWTLLGLFFILTTGLSFGFCQSFFGFFIHLFNRDRLRITGQLSLEDQAIPDQLDSRNALLFPIYNEDPTRFYDGIVTTYRALEASGLLDHFYFFILSDSTEPNRWIEEEKQWLEVSHKLNAKGRIIYRHRVSNINQKSGNVSDFCRRWGGQYDHMICFDADSLMSAQCIIKLVRMMELYPSLGIIQTMPGLFGGETLFARLQQFANRIHGEISGAGLNYWQQSEGNYWGHNAIIRLKPFIESCALPELPGPKPLGGRVLSHDFVEAALMRKAGYEVWLAYDIGDSFEELPPTLLDYVARDRRWCQGNLQHTWIALFGKIPLINRIHMLNGVYAYLAAPLWLLFLLVSTLSVYSWERTGLSLITRGPLFFLSPQNITTHGIVILAITMGMILLPKCFTLLRLLYDRGFRQRFGGGIRASLSVLLEVLCFSLMAPVLMLFHSAFVFSIITGNKVKWSSQNRSNTAHTSWAQATTAHIGQSLVGLLWAFLAWKINPVLFYWMSPLILGWLIAIPLSVITSHTVGARWLREKGYLLTPEEHSPPDIIKALQANTAQSEPELVPIETLRPDFGLIQVILDPYINSLHLEFLPNRRNQTAQTKEYFESLAIKLINEGAPAFDKSEKDRLLNDPYTIRALHKKIWSLPEAGLHPWWRLAMSRYSRRSLYVADQNYEKAYI